MKKCNKGNCLNKSTDSDGLLLLNEFYRDRSKKDGHCGTCKTCDDARPRKLNKEKVKARSKRWRESEGGQEYYKKYYLDNKESHYINGRKWAEGNRDRKKELDRNHSKTDKCRKRHRRQQAKRRAAKLNATFEGYDGELKDIYDNCPKGFHVDHIVPLVNNIVCGLHVPWNLQYLTVQENLKKNNKLLR